MDKYAPDLTEQFMQLKTAYDILRRSARRKQYDKMMGIERLKRFNSVKFIFFLNRCFSIN